MVLTVKQDRRTNRRSNAASAMTSSIKHRVVLAIVVIPDLLRLSGGRGSLCDTSNAAHHVALYSRLHPYHALVFMDEIVTHTTINAHGHPDNNGETPVTSAYRLPRTSNWCNTADWVLTSSRKTSASNPRVNSMISRAARSRSSRVASSRT